jgi:hypothetical protein
MSRFMNPVAGFAALLCLLGTVNLAPMAAQGPGSRQPDVADWRFFHRNNDAYWAQMVAASTGSNFSASDVRNIRLAAGIADDEADDPIMNLDGRGMRPDQYLLLTAKRVGCVKAAVYERGMRQFKELWSSDELADEGDICQQPGCPAPQVSIVEKHTISVRMYFRSVSGNPICDQLKTTTYEPKRNTFEKQDQRTGTSMCWVGYDAGLSAALWQAAGPDKTLAIVQVFPTVAAHPDRYALALAREGERLRIVRMEWPEKGSPYVGDLSKASASDCYSRLSSVPIQATELEVPQVKAVELATALSGIDLRADRCVRNGESQCARFFDGRTFHVEVRGHVPVNVFDLENEKGYVSENPKLSEWIYQLLDESKLAKEAAAN